MIDPHHAWALRAAAVAGLLALALSGCTGMGDTMASQAFADPARYDLYDCKQLAVERKKLATDVAEFEGLIAKAKTGAGGAAVAEVAYGNGYVSARAQAKLADEAWERNRCAGAGSTVAPSLKPAGTAASGRAGSGLY